LSILISSAVLLIVAVGGAAVPGRSIGESHSPTGKCAIIADRTLMDCRKQRTAFVTEIEESNDLSRYSGRFTVHWEDETGHGSGEGPNGVPAEEAIEWGRRHAEVVQVLIAGENLPYSAGDRQPADETLPVWPPGGIDVRPRPMGSPRDGSQQVVEWLLRSDAEMPPPDDPALDRLRDQVERAPEVADVVSVTRTTHGVTVVYAIRARSGRAAVLAGYQLVKDAARQVLPPGVEHAGLEIAVRTESWEIE
jgi:hypothetical protein